MSNVNDFPFQGATNPLLSGFQARQQVSKPPLFKGTDFPHSMNLLDVLAGKLMPGLLKIDANATPNVSHAAIPASPKRVALIFLVPTAGTITWSTETTVVSGQGVNVGSQSAPVVMSSRDVGDLVTREWYVISSSVTIFPCWIEVYGPDNVCLEDQMRQGTNWGGS